MWSDALSASASWSVSMRSKIVKRRRSERTRTDSGFDATSSRIARRTSSGVRIVLALCRAMIGAPGGVSTSRVKAVC